VAFKKQLAEKIAARNAAFQASLAGDAS
jgi:hypothetical protein